MLIPMSQFEHGIAVPETDVQLVQSLETGKVIRLPGTTEGNLGLTLSL